MAIPAAGTRRCRSSRAAFVQSLALDEISVIRLHNRTDEPFGDRSVQRSRIARISRRRVRFRSRDISTAPEIAGARFSGVVVKWKATTIGARSSSASAPRRLRYRANRRRAACDRGIGRRLGGCGERVGESQRRGLLRRSRAARCCAADGLPSLTGGEVFATTSDIGPAIDRILQRCRQLLHARLLADRHDARASIRSTSKCVPAQA